MPLLKRPRCPVCGKGYYQIEETSLCNNCSRPTKEQFNSWSDLVIEAVLAENDRLRRQAGFQILVPRGNHLYLRIGEGCYRRIGRGYDQKGSRRVRRCFRKRKAAK